VMTPFTRNAQSVPEFGSAPKDHPATALQLPEPAVNVSV
jgi:hypothetical protein